ncbi:LADA_0E02762g1_1 [Lachancea dasiensis]|uniref:LADA_0E02762g1_1 n=1 Tax=Lachancea dasiensis TaxID=1072105 RepID=A0A1G4JAX6_9SACH|nr:LADA_0E02762g1_1 [Lachancea dasiensis]
MYKVKNIVGKLGHQESSQSQGKSVLKDPIRSDSEVASLAERSSESPKLLKGESVNSLSAIEVRANVDLHGKEFSNRCPDFEDVRNVPFASTVLGKGFMAFPSENSYTKFRQNKRRLDCLNDTQAVGFPFLHAVSLNLFKSLIHGKAPVMKIHRFALVDTSRDEDWAVNYKEDEHCQLLASNGDLRVYKLTFCEIFQHIESKTSHVEYRLVFRIDNRPTRNLFCLKMLGHILHSDCDTRVDDLALRWYGVSGLASSFGASKFDLRVLDDNIPSFLDYLTDKEYSDARKKVPNSRHVAKLPIWATYSDESSTVIPKNRTLKHANFKINEMSHCSESLRDIPWDTLILTSMCMLLHDIESKKEKATSHRYSTLGLALAV